MRVLNVLTLALVAVACACANEARGAAADSQALESIRASVASFLAERVPEDVEDAQVRVSRLDPRLRLPPCSAPLAPFLPAGRSGGVGAVTVGVRCEGQRPWTVYVPARVEAFRSVAVAARPIGRGEQLSVEDLRLERREVSKLRQGYVTRIEDVTGLQARRTLSVGTALNARMLTQPTVIRRGELVTLVADSGLITVRTEGRAMRDGQRGQVISVRNVRSNRVVEGVVVSRGVVKVRL